MDLSYDALEEVWSSKEKSVFQDFQWIPSMTHP